MEKEIILTAYFEAEAKKEKAEKRLEDVENEQDILYRYLRDLEEDGGAFDFVLEVAYFINDEISKKAHDLENIVEAWEKVLDGLSKALNNFPD